MLDLIIFTVGGGLMIMVVMMMIKLQTLIQMILIFQKINQKFNTKMKYYNIEMKKNTYKPIQFIPKNNEQSNVIKKNDTKLTYQEIRKIVENKNEKEIPNIREEKHIKNNKFNIV
jgi:hypothetical protein